MREIGKKSFIEISPPPSKTIMAHSKGVLECKINLILPTTSSDEWNSLTDMDKIKFEEAAKDR